MKKIMFVVIALIMGCACTAHAQKGFSAPLGLSWGESKEKIIKKYGGVPAKKNEGRLKSYSLSHPPLKIPGFHEYYGVIDESLGLVKVILIENIKEDVFGVKGVESYTRLKDVLSKKYGEAKSQYEYVGREFYKNNDEFYQCLAYQGCGLYSSLYKPRGGGGISLEIKGLCSGVGYISINYESVLFDNALKDREDDSNKKAEQGL